MPSSPRPSPNHPYLVSVSIIILFVLLLLLVPSKSSPPIAPPPPTLDTLHLDRPPQQLLSAPPLETPAQTVPPTLRPLFLLPIPPARTCTPAEANRQAALVKTARFPGCSPHDDIYLRILHQVNPAATVFFDIGSNKGYTAAHLLQLWTALSINPRILYETHKRLSIRPDVTQCGMCNDCRDPSLAKIIAPAICRKLAPPLGQQTCASYRALNKSTLPPPHVYSFDGNPVLVEAVSKAISRLHLQNAWTVTTAAFSDSYTPGKTISFVINSEFGHIVENAANRSFDSRPSAITVTSPLLTVDQACLERQITHIDLLKIDTEGFDAYVLHGASNMFARNAVDAVFFEYNEFWPFDHHTLHSTTSWLETNYNFSCYLEGPRLARLTNGCWHPKLELKQWSNVWCLSRNTPVGKVTAALFDSDYFTL